MWIFKGRFAVLTGTVLLFSFVRESIVVPGRVVRLDYGPHHPDIIFTMRTGERI